MDIIIVAVCLDNLGITECIVPVLYEGCGTIRCKRQHSSVPVPAVANIVSEHNLDLSITESKGEFVTPTGAAIVAAIRTSKVLPGIFRKENRHGSRKKRVRQARNPKSHAD